MKKKLKPLVLFNWFSLFIYRQRFDFRCARLGMSLVSQVPIVTQYHAAVNSQPTNYLESMEMDLWMLRNWKWLWIIMHGIKFFAPYPYDSVIPAQILAYHTVFGNIGCHVDAVFCSFGQLILIRCLDLFAKSYPCRAHPVTVPLWWNIWRNQSKQLTFIEALRLTWFGLRIEFLPIQT